MKDKACVGQYDQCDDKEIYMPIHCVINRPQPAHEMIRKLEPVQEKNRYGSIKKASGIGCLGKRPEQENSKIAPNNPDVP